MHDCFHIWYNPTEDEIVVYVTQEEIAKIGGISSEMIFDRLNLNYFTNLGVSHLARWCRQNCREPGRPANIRGKLGWVFRYESDALLFKLTWGGL